MTTAVQILKEELEKKGIIAAEKVALDLYEALKASAARMTIEADESAVKAIAPVLTIVLTAMESQVKGLIDFNKDGKIGE